MHKLSRLIVVLGIVAAFGFGIAAMAGLGVQPVGCPLPDPDKAEKCPQTVLQPWRCGICLYVNKCYARAAGWNVSRNCQSNIGSEPPTPTRP
jgi:hypothetical protein